MDANRFSEDLPVITEVAGQYNAQDLENEVRLLWEKGKPTARFGN